MRDKIWVQRIGWIILIACSWEMSSRLGLVNQFLLPSFSKVMSELIRELVNGKFAVQIMNSFGLILIGFLISLILTVIICLGCVYSKVFNSLIDTLCTIMTPLPGVAVMPIIIMIFGIDTKAMIVLMLHSVLWPLVINILGGMILVPQIQIDYARNIGLSKREIMLDIYAHFMMPCLISGLKIGWSRSWRALISAEMVFGMIGNIGGVGYYIFTNRAYGNITRVMAGVIVIIVIGVFMESVVLERIQEKTIKKWGLDRGI